MYIYNNIIHYAIIKEILSFFFFNYSYYILILFLPILNFTLQTGYLYFCSHLDYIIMNKLL